MIVFDLVCQPGGHQFEGWFSSSSDYETQKEQGLLSCPSCGTLSVGKAVMAPNVGAKGNQRSGAAEPVRSAPSESGTGAEPAAVSNVVEVPAKYQELLDLAAKAQAKLLEKSEWVGDDFPEKAREIHYGEADEKPIHGIATPDDAAALEDEGIDIAALPLPVTPPKSQN
ncbi:DUF1178 family protein [Parasphingorhabdus sp.]|uniref:DUF1178 family protein n=1 Tax=Parasphingorhabdus sp. TaxID=2709688 RepID=UPI003263F89E